jgi:S-phase kinase-associated protein 1
MTSKAETTEKVTITLTPTDLSTGNVSIPPKPPSLDDDDHIETKEEVKTDTEIDGLDGLDDNTCEKIYTMVSKDNKIFKINGNSFYMSGLLKTLLECEEKEELLLPNITSDILSKVILYLEHHVVEPVPQDNSPEKLKSNIFSENIKCLWDVKFIENDIMGNPITAKETLYELIRAANYMDIQTLLQLSCTKVACMIKGESLEAIGQIISPEVPYVDNHKPV